MGSPRAIDFENWRSQFTASDLDELIEDAQQYLDRLHAARQLVDEPEPEPPQNAAMPTSKPDQIVWVLLHSGLPSMSGSAIFGALAMQGWITDADKSDDKHFHKTLQKLFERGVLFKPKRGHYALDPDYAGPKE